MNVIFHISNTLIIYYYFQGVAELPPNIRRWIYVATVFAPNAVPIISYGMIVSSAFMLIFVFVRSYKNFVFQTDPTIEILEMGRRSLRRGSSFLSQSQHRILAHRDSYILLKADNNNEGDSPSQYSSESYSLYVHQALYSSNKL